MTIQRPKRLKMSNFESLHARTLVVVAVIAIGFTFYLTVSLVESRNQASLLEQIQHRSYPVHAHLQEAMYSLKQTQVQLEGAAITGESYHLDRALQFAAQFRQSIQAVQNLDQELRGTTEKILIAFNRFYRNSYELALSMLEGVIPTDYTIIQARQNTTEFEEMVKQLESFQLTEAAQFTDGVGHVTDRANRVVQAGFALGFLTLILLAGISWFLVRRVLGRISYMIGVLRAIAENDDSLSVRIPIDRRDEMSELAFWFNSFIDKLERLTKKNSQEMENLAYTDTLTELPNRRFFSHFLEKEIERCRRSPGEILSILFIDLDNFKDVNDQFGHDVGDLLLCEVSRRLSENLRSSDLLVLDSQDKGSVVARMGGDEFMLLVRSQKDPTDAAYVAEKLRRAVLAPVEVGGQHLQVGVSIGIATYPGNGNSAEELVVNADLAMYEAKRRGKNSYCFFNEDIGLAADLGLEMDRLLRHSFENGEMELYVQPKFDLNSGDISGAEMLLRWNSPQLGSVSPDKFIPVAESSSLIYEIDDWVLTQSCQLISTWQKKNICQIPIAINISAKQAGRPDLIDKVKRAIEHHPIAANSLELEITETSALAYLEEVAKNIQDLKSLSVKVGLDDFGAGHSSLSLLKHCDIDTLKIDRGFISELETTRNARSIIEAIINLAQKLNVEVVAEGVETVRQSELLALMGCDTAQGFLYAPPMPIAEFEKFLLESDNHARRQCL